MILDLVLAGFNHGSLEDLERHECPLGEREGSFGCKPSLFSAKCLECLDFFVDDFLDLTECLECCDMESKVGR